MGFIQDFRRIVREFPAERQTLFFSATMPDEIKSLANSILRDPVTVRVAPVSATADRSEQTVHYVPKANKPELLCQILRELPDTRVLVFTRTKHGANRLGWAAADSGFRA